MRRDGVMTMPILDETDMIAFIQKETGYSRKMVMNVLNAEMTYMIKVGIATTNEKGDINEIDDYIHAR